MDLKNLNLIITAALLVFTCGNTIFGQTKIVGKVTYDGSFFLPNANVSIEGSYDGTTSLKDGTYTFVTEERGTHIIVAKLSGYEDVYRAVTINDTTTIHADIVFTSKSLMLGDVVVKGKTAETSDKIRVTTLNPTEVLTTATDGSIVSALKTLPGAQQVGESSDLFVRGGTGSETKIFMDGLLMNNFNYSSTQNLASSNRFPAGWFTGAYFSSGGYSALYGQALSSTLILESGDLPSRSSADLAINPLFAEGTLQILSKDKRTLIGTSIKYMDLAFVFDINKPKVDFVKSPAYLDGSLFLKKKISKNGLLKFFGSVGKSSLSLKQPNLDYPLVEDNVGLRNRNVYTNLSYKQSWNNWRLYIGSSYNGNIDKLNVETKTKGESSLTHYDSLAKDESTLLQVKAVLTNKIHTNTTINWGGEFFRSKEALNSNLLGTGLFTDNLTALFVEAESYFQNNFSARIGGRFEHSSLLNKTNFAPRVSLGYTFKNQSLLNLSYGQFFQKPEKNFLLRDHSLDYMIADHYIVSYQKIDNYYTFRTELFYKQYDQLVKTTSDLSSDGSGFARGIEVFWRDKKSLKGFDYWISYSFLDTERNYLNFPFSAQPSFAADHTASLTLKKFFPKIRTNISTTYTFATGRPYYNPNRQSEDFMSDKTKDYNNLGLSIAYLPNLKIKNTFSVIALTFSNLLWNEQVFGYNYSNVDFSRRNAITPTNNPFVFLGLFVNFGIDRRDNIIDGL